VKILKVTFKQLINLEASTEIKTEEFPSTSNNNNNSLMNYQQTHSKNLGIKVSGVIYFNIFKFKKIHVLLKNMKK
jgi:hypothetical protein